MTIAEIARIRAAIDQIPPATDDVINDDLRFTICMERAVVELGLSAAQVEELTSGDMDSYWSWYMIRRGEEGHGYGFLCFVEECLNTRIDVAI